MNLRRILRVLRFVAVAALALAAIGFVVMSLWNWLAPAAFGGHLIGFWQALGLFVLARLLVGGWRGRHGHWHRHAHAGHRMSDDERERLRAGFARRCGGRRDDERRAPAQPA
jgi:Na+-driven multidrug efflux pump